MPTDAERRLRETLDKLERDNMWRPWMSEGALITAPFDCAAVCAVLDDLTVLRDLARRALDLMSGPDPQRGETWIQWGIKRDELLAEDLAVRLRTK